MAKIYTNAELTSLFERHLAQLQLPDDPAMLYAPIRYALAEGGKRMAAPDYFRGHPLN
jgi:hypothetical protein